MTKKRPKNQKTIDEGNGAKGGLFVSVNVRGGGERDVRLLQEAVELCSMLSRELVSLRRDLHMHPELGWTEFRTTALVVSRLQELGFEVFYGSGLYGGSRRAALPDESLRNTAWQRALEAAKQEEIDAQILQSLKGSFTGCVATLRTGRPGPTIAFRVDLDALPIVESEYPAHRPAAEAWRSRHEGIMHACGHDGHTAIGIGLAHVIAHLSPHLNGTVKLIFQPAEEGGRGAASLVEAGHLDDVDYFVALHLGLGAPEGTVATGASGFLATSKYRVRFRGTPAHAGKAPEEGKNALLAAATAVLNLHTLTQSGQGQTRLNVGVLHAGTATNIVPAEAVMEFEVRGDSARVHQVLEERALRVVNATALIHDTELSIEQLGNALSTPSDIGFAEEIQEVLLQLAPHMNVVTDFRFGASEDATIMMERVQQRGGKATLGIIGTDLRGDHHQPNFDVSDDSLVNGLLYFVAALFTSMSASACER